MLSSPGVVHPMEVDGSAFGERYTVQGLAQKIIHVGKNVIFIGSHAFNAGELAIVCFEEGINRKWMLFCLSVCFFELSTRTFKCCAHATQHYSNSKESSHAEEKEVVPSDIQGYQETP